MTTEELTFFDNIAPKWDSMEVKSTPDKITEILDIIGVGSGSDILDLGTGTGVLIPYLSRLTGPGGTVMAVDFSEGMLREAERKFSGLGNVYFSRLDFEEEREPWRYDLIMMYCVYPHLSYPKETVKRLVTENLKPGGRLIIGFPTDEKFINSIHHDHAVEDDLGSEHLPSAPTLATRINKWGLHARVLAYDEGKYLVEIMA